MCPVSKFGSLSLNRIKTGFLKAIDVLEIFCKNTKFIIRSIYFRTENKTYRFFIVQMQSENIIIDDAVLVRQARLGDTSAMGRLILKYQDRVFNAVLKICGNYADAAELTQETFVKVIEKLDMFEGRSTFYTWIFRVAVNLSLNYCKRQSKLRIRSLDAAVSAIDGEAKVQLSSFLTDEKASDPAEIAQIKEIQGIVLEAVKILDDDQRTVVVLRDIEGMNYVDIAETLDIELGTVKSRLSRARAALRDILKDVLG